MSEPVPTDCEALDDLLGGGFERGAVTQLYGPPAAGKTNVALSAAVGVATAGDSVLYIDTEGLSVDRFQQLIETTADEPTEDVAARLIITDALDFDDQQEAVRDAADFAERVELIVLDSATGFYRLNRAGDAEGGDSLRAVARQITELLSLARKHDIAVVITNQVYSDPESDRVKALGGHTLEHWTGVVVRLDRFRGGNRRATLEKHRAKAAGETATFKITEQGIESADPV
ncbi:MAG: DNA repair and recombination protein RadB [uncultured archaeon A07HN63]|nr:MAG: DNA repair and recombination protein RadB [uncultured archaeon A07HN63]